MYDAMFAIICVGKCLKRDDFDWLVDNEGNGDAIFSIWQVSSVDNLDWDCVRWLHVD